MMETKWRGVALAVFPPAMLEVFDDEATILDSCNIMRKPSALVVRPEKYLADAALHYNNPCLTITGIRARTNSWRPFPSHTNKRIQL
ncbi:hypothetical protein WJX84_007043 [Apatococcus fuscideae]|uniref:Uncharacterized protein n=1 Tax=Apatococcus fuscideae TaxID=2026836 RepID=A0AAW1S8R0_9CHLO